MSPAPVEPINDAIFSPMPKFDPRAVPVFSIDVDLPAVAPTQLTAAALRIRFGAPPIWEPEVRVEPLFADRIPAAAAVLIPIVLRAGAVLDAEAVIAHCRSEIASYKAPRSVEFRDALPLSAAGKLQKFQLREPFWAGRSRRVN